MAAMMDSANTGIGALPVEAPEQEFDYQNSGGIGANMYKFAEMLAEKGRGPDTVVGHLTPGEIVVPTDILEQNPQVQEMIFAELRLAGVENPERYLVGSDANSINPETGMPEFIGFVKKAFKQAKKTVSNVGKSLSKAVSGVGKVLKKVAPVVLPIALAMTPLGAIYGAALGSGIGTLIAGGNIKDALKASLISGAMGGITAGIGSKMAGGTFTGGVQSAAANPMGRFQQFGQGLSGNQAFFSSYAAPDATGATTTTGQSTGDAAADAARAGSTPTDVQEAAARLDYSNQALSPEEVQARLARGQTTGVDMSTGMGQPEVTQGQFGDYSAAQTTAPSRGFGSRAGTFTGADTGSRVLEFDASGNLVDLGATTTAPAPQTSFMDRVGSAYDTTTDYLFRGGQSEAAIKEANKLAAERYLAETPRHLQSAAGYEAALSSQNPGMLATYGPSLGLAGAGLYAAGAFDVPEQPEPDLGGAEEQFEGTRYFEMTPEERERFRIQGLDPNRYQGRDSYSIAYGENNPYLGRFSAPYDPYSYNPVTYAAGGGEMSAFPRRTGYISGPGTETSDDVPAMLSDGEFVMTARAVRGAGNGSRQQGVRNMMNMMKNFEMRAA